MVDKYKFKHNKQKINHIDLKHLKKKPNMLTTEITTTKVIHH